MASQNIFKLCLVILSFLLIGLLFGNADRAIDKIQEARIAETAREMVVTNDWVLPQYNGELRLQKPPLTYWTTAVSYRIFGVSEWSARIPSLLFALLSAALLFVWAKSALNPEAAINAVVVLLTSFLGLRYFRSAEADATLLFFILLAAYASFQLFEKPDKKMAGLFMLALGLGFLTKGPAGIAIPFLTALLYGFIIKRLFALKTLINPAGIAILLISAFAWYAWILFTMPDVAQQFFSKQVDETFISGTHQQPIYWYLAHATEFFAPWSLLLIPAGIWTYQHRPLPNLIRFALIWLLVVFVLLTFTVNKQTQYALLLLPPIAILIGHYIQAAEGKFYQFNRIIFWLLLVASLAIFVLGFRKHADLVLSFPTVFIWPLLIIAPLVLKKMLKVNWLSTPVLIAAILATFNYLYVEQYLASDNEKDDIKQLVLSSLDIQKAYQTRPGNGALSFYAKRPVKAMNEEQLQQLLNTESEIYLFSKDKPELKAKTIAAEKQAGHWTLWKLTAN